MTLLRLCAASVTRFLSSTSTTARSREYASGHSLLRIWRGVRQEPSDDEWVLSITDASRGHMEIMNPRTGHFMAVHNSHVERLVRDTVPDTPNGPRHGILNLNVQLVFEDGRLRLEPLQSLNDRVSSLSRGLHESGYEDQHERVQALIREARQTLVRPDGALGPWEALELDYGESAVATNFLMALITAVPAEAARNVPSSRSRHREPLCRSIFTGKAAQ
jgi:hypothetical protein